jgi:hypothetical protein
MLVLSRCVWLAKVLYRFALHPITRYVVSWLLALGVGWLCTAHAWDCWKDESRPDGNAGHTAIDFGGQWIMGRMLVTGQGAYLYNRDRVRDEMGVGYHLPEKPELQTGHR